MVRLIAFVLLLVLGSTPLHAQCTSSVGQGPNWPLTVVFDPPAPAANHAVAAMVTPATSSMLYGLSVVPSGSTIDVQGSLDEWGILPPPAAPLRIQLGSFPAGRYLVRIRLIGNGASPCTPLDANLVVGGGAVASSVPTIGAVAAVVLAIMLLWLAGRRYRRA